MGSIYRRLFWRASVIALFALQSSAADFPHWIDDMLPGPGSGTIEDEVKCYSLPYGGIGFTSHVLTYYTLVCLWGGRAPWWPLHRLNSWKLDFVLGASTLVVAVAISVFTMYRCKNAWPFILIATQKLLLSFSLGCTTIHRAIDVRRITKYGTSSHISYEPSPNPEKPSITAEYSEAPFGWIAFYACGAIIGLVGDIALLVQVWTHRTKDINIVTGVFGGVVLLVAVLVAIMVCCDDGSFFGTIFGGFFGAALMAGIVAALYGDWLLSALMVGKKGSVGWVGLPSSDIAPLYWTYFVFKRLPIFSL